MLRGRLVAAAVGAAVVGTVAAGGCTALVPGVPAPAAGANPPAPAPGAPRVAPRTGLVVDVLPDECLLFASELGALVGRPVPRPAQGVVRDPAGPRGSGCVVGPGARPLALVNVYAVRSGTPADVVRAGPRGGRRELPGVGEAAAVVEAEAGPTLQLAAPRHLVTILVTTRRPTDAEWRAAADAALTRLPR